MSGQRHAGRRNSIRPSASRLDSSLAGWSHPPRSKPRAQPQPQPQPQVQQKPQNNPESKLRDLITEFSSVVSDLKRQHESPSVLSAPQSHHRVQNDREETGLDEIMVLKGTSSREHPTCVLRGPIGTQIELSSGQVMVIDILVTYLGLSSPADQSSTKPTIEEIGSEAFCVTTTDGKIQISSACYSDKQNSPFAVLIAKQRKKPGHTTTALEFEVKLEGPDIVIDDNRPPLQRLLSQKTILSSQKELLFTHPQTVQWSASVCSRLVPGLDSRFMNPLKRENASSTSPRKPAPRVVQGECTRD